MTTITIERCEGCGHDRSTHGRSGYPCVVSDCTCVEYVPVDVELDYRPPS